MTCAFFLFINSSPSLHPPTCRAVVSVLKMETDGLADPKQLHDGLLDAMTIRGFPIHERNPAPGNTSTVDNVLGFFLSNGPREPLAKNVIGHVGGAGRSDVGPHMHPPSIRKNSITQSFPRVSFTLPVGGDVRAGRRARFPGYDSTKSGVVAETHSDSRGHFNFMPPDLRRLPLPPIPVGDRGRLWSARRGVARVDGGLMAPRRPISGIKIADGEGGKGAEHKGAMVTMVTRPKTSTRTSELATSYPGTNNRAQLHRTHSVHTTGSGTVASQQKI